MNERLLQFIWQFQYFNKGELQTTAGEAIQIIFPGHSNTNQGPDFLDAKIKLGATTWAGTVELHLKTSDWEKHNHQNDDNYKNVILHIVWEDDGGITHIPILILKNRVSTILLNRYEELMETESFIPCEKSIASVKDITWQSWKDRLLAERLLRKAKIFQSRLTQNKNHWEETFWWLLCRNFGSVINANSFEAIAQSIPITVLAKHKNQIHQVEALLLGQAGLLNNSFTEDYPQLLQREYAFLKEKYKLKPIHHPIHFLRMRPGNFPTIRLAQLAMLVTTSAHLFTKIREIESIKDVSALFDVTANDFWHYHYQLNEPGIYKQKKLGQVMINNILINTAVPALFAYGVYHNEEKYKTKALKWLEETKAETNSITNGFKNLGELNKNAFDSQSFIELKNEYCTKKRCLECAIGNSLLRQHNM